VKRFERQQAQLELDALLDRQPVEAVPQHMSDVVVLLGYCLFRANNIMTMMIVTKMLCCFIASVAGVCVTFVTRCS